MADLTEEEMFALEEARTMAILRGNSAVAPAPAPAPAPVTVPPKNKGGRPKGSGKKSTTTTTPLNAGNITVNVVPPENDAWLTIFCAMLSGSASVPSPGVIKAVANAADLALKEYQSRL